MSRVVVSLSTIPSRFYGITSTLDSLVNQKRLPDTIHLNLCHQYRRESITLTDEDVNCLRSTLSKEINDRLCINWGRDYGPATKLIPAIQQEKDPETIIITVDDDWLYSDEFIAFLVSKAQQYPQAAVSLVGEKLIGVIPLYAIIRRDVHIDMVNGANGVAYRRKFFITGEEIINPPYYFPSESRLEDDFMIPAWLKYRGVPCMRTPFHIRLSLKSSNDSNSLTKYHGLRGKWGRYLRTAYYMGEHGFATVRVPRFIKPVLDLI
jgi:hypothetical protein